MGDLRQNTHIVANFDRLSSTAIMATELTVQSERAFQKQPHIFQNAKKQSGKAKRAGKGGRRWVKDVGLGFRTPKTARYERRHKNLAAHVSPAFRVEEGDQVTVGQCRPLSKTVRFNVLRVLPRTGKAVKQFNKF